MNNDRNKLLESDMLDRIKRGKLELRPITFCYLQNEIKANRLPGVDALIEGSWDTSKATFAVEFKTLSTPKVFSESIAYLKSLVLPKAVFPLLLVPYLNDAQLKELEDNVLCGIDFCGNGAIIIPNKLSVIRTGQPNQFPSNSPIKNIYRKNSSIVARVFLAVSEYSSVKQVLEEICKRDIYSAIMQQSSVTGGTVSKVLAQLEQDLLIERTIGKIRLLQPDSLVDKLARNYSEEKQNTICTSMKVKMERPELIAFLAQESHLSGLPIMATGLSSVSRYAIMQRDDKLSVYCPRMEDLIERLPKDQILWSDRFPNFEVIKMKESAVYFEAVMEQNFLWSSPLQAFLELSAGDKRDQETAVQIKENILKNLRN